MFLVSIGLGACIEVAIHSADCEPSLCVCCMFGILVLLGSKSPPPPPMLQEGDGVFVVMCRAWFSPNIQIVLCHSQRAHFVASDQKPILQLTLESNAFGWSADGYV